MPLNEVTITKAIIDRYTKKLTDNLSIDVGVVGGGPAGLVAAAKLAAAGRKVALFERKLSLGGGMWGGGMMFNEIVVQEEGKRILDEFGISANSFRKGYYTADSVEAVAALVLGAKQAGAAVFNLVSAEDVVVRKGRVSGLVINWTAVEMARLHVDPLTVACKYVVDATGHAVEIVRLLRRKMDVELFTETGDVMGERSLWADRAETSTLENTREVYPGIYVAGMSANATFGSYRMGPIFGGMLLSGEAVAAEIDGKLGK